MYKLFGISNCDTVKKAKEFLTKSGVEFHFVDFKKYKPTKDDLVRWSKSFNGLPVNMKGSTYKKHKEYYENLNEMEKIPFLQENTSMIKRPILERDHEVLAFGFDRDDYRILLNKN